MNTRRKKFISLFVIIALVLSLGIIVALKDGNSVKVFTVGEKFQFDEEDTVTFNFTTTSEEPNFKVWVANRDSQDVPYIVTIRDSSGDDYGIGSFDVDMMRDDASIFNNLEADSYTVTISSFYTGVNGEIKVTASNSNFGLIPSGEIIQFDEKETVAFSLTTTNEEPNFEIWIENQDTQNVPYRVAIKDSSGASYNYVDTGENGFTHTHNDIDNSRAKNESGETTYTVTISSEPNGHINSSSVKGDIRITTSSTPIETIPLDEKISFEGLGSANCYFKTTDENPNFKVWVENQDDQNRTYEVVILDESYTIGDNEIDKFEVSTGINGNYMSFNGYAPGWYRAAIITNDSFGTVLEGEILVTAEKDKL